MSKEKEWHIKIRITKTKINSMAELPTRIELL